MKKICSKCGVLKPIECFGIHRKKYKEKVYICRRNHCWDCSKQDVAKWKREHPEKRRAYAKKFRQLYPEREKAQRKKYRENNPQKGIEQDKRWIRKHPDLDRERHRKWRSKNPDKVKAMWNRAGRKTRSTLSGGLRSRMSSGICGSLRGNKNGRHWETLVGYSLKELIKHLESKFQTGMTWQNYGIKGWHIDHIIPLSRLYIDGTDDPTFKFAWSLKNLQPLWAKDNLTKRNNLAFCHEQGEG